MSFTKSELRLSMKQTLRNHKDREQKSDSIWRNLARLSEFQDAVCAEKLIVVFANLSTEVQTTRFFEEHFFTERSKSLLAVPYCHEGEIELFRLESLAELVPQTLGILEPHPDLKADALRRVLPDELGLILTPGLAFDSGGGRLGRGAGYYDRFLARFDSQRETPIPKFALAFECQILDRIPTEPHDVPLDGIITESRILRVSSYCG